MDLCIAQLWPRPGECAIPVDHRRHCAGLRPCLTVMLKVLCGERARTAAAHQRPGAHGEVVGREARLRKARQLEERYVPTAQNLPRITVDVPQEHHGMR